MIPFINLLNMKGEIDICKTEIVKETLKGWILDVESAYNKSEFSTGTGSTSGKELKDDNFDPFKIAGKSLEISYQSICTGEIHDVNRSINARAEKHNGNQSRHELLPSLRITVSICMRDCINSYLNKLLTLPMV